MSLSSNNATVESQKINFSRGIRSVSKLYSCTVIDVHPEKNTVDVVISKLSKTIEDVSIISGFVGRDCANVAIPERNTEAILASTEDSKPFIIAYKYVSSYKNQGYFNNELQEGESQSSFSKQSFEKNDAYGGVFKSSGDSDWIILSDFSIHDETTKRIISAAESVNICATKYDNIARAYSVEEIKKNSTLLSSIVQNTKRLIESTIQNSGDSIYNLLSQISEDDIDISLIEKIISKIDGFLCEKQELSLKVLPDKVTINDINLYMLTQNFIPTNIISFSEERNINGNIISANATRKIFINPENNNEIYRITTYTFIDEEYKDYIEEEIRFVSGETYLKKIQANSNSITVEKIENLLNE